VSYIKPDMYYVLNLKTKPDASLDIQNIESHKAVNKSNDEISQYFFSVVALILTSPLGPVRGAAFFGHFFEEIAPSTTKKNLVCQLDFTCQINASLWLFC
jgi:hypothetical protein